MKNIILFFILLFIYAFAKAQSPDAELLTKIQTASTTDINNITGAEEGMLTYDSQEKRLKAYDGTQWTDTSTSSTVIMDRRGGTLNTNNNTFSDFPVTPANIQSQTGTAVTVLANGHIRINQSGQYMLVGGLSTTNLPQGTRKFILAIFRGTTRIGYLSRGFTTQPNAGTDFWGTSGTLIYTFAAGEKLFIDTSLIMEELRLPETLSM